MSDLHVVSVSLGSSKRDKRNEVEFLGRTITLERRGCDGDTGRFRDLLSELDGKVDAIGIGGADMWVVIEERRYGFREILALTSVVKKTPVVDGSGLKHTLERAAIEQLQLEATVDFRNEQTLLVSAVDRFGMAQALNRCGGQVIYGDLLFALGLPIPVRRYSTVVALGKLMLPLITRLPFKWFYPTGSKQEKRTPKHPRVFEWASVICGDWHFIRRYAPDNLVGKTVLTQTIRADDLQFLRERRIARVITTTPVIGGETFATNVMESAIVALLGRWPEQITGDEMQRVLADLAWKPTVVAL